MIDKLHEKIFRYGKYYFPAYEHYKMNVMVNCDRCTKNNLYVCIGWRNHDLCMICVNEIDEILHSKYYDNECECDCEYNNDSNCVSPLEEIMEIVNDDLHPV